MTAPIQLYGPYRNRRSRLRRAFARWFLHQWLGTWPQRALLTIAVGALVAGAPFLAGALSAYLWP